MSPELELDPADFATLDEVIASAHHAWRPPPRLSLSEWADQHYYLSAESSAQAGRWTTLPYQKGILDAITDPLTTHVSVMKSARVGYTKCMNAAIGYHIDQNPCPMLVVQPTVDDAKGYSKEEIAPMLRDCPRLTNLVIDDPDEKSGPRDSANTILHKRFPGGVLSMVGANSGAGFRRISRRVVIFDEVDGYPPSAGSDGDPVKLGTRRADFYHDRKIIAGSTPLIAGHSRIEQMFQEGDGRRYFVPCPHCGHMDFFVFSERESGGHFMRWEKDRPETAHFECRRCGCEIEHKDKREMVARGEWRGERPFTGHASFHIWAAYSFSPNASWADIVQAFLAAGKDREQLKTFINTWLGETWKESGDAPDWERLYQRRESYPIGSVPAGVQFLTCGVDVQKDRWVYEVVGWDAHKRSWSIDAGVIPGDTSLESDWVSVDQLLERQYASPVGPMVITRLAIDAGYNTNTVYNWGRTKPWSRVIAIKGASTQRASLIGVPTPVDVSFRGQRLARGYRVWSLGVDVAKSELYGWLRLQPPTDPAAEAPPGFCHFPEHGEDFFKQLTAEHLVESVTRQGFRKFEWQVQPGRENHWLDARVYARAAAATLGLDRMAPPPPVVAVAQAAPPAPPPALFVPPPPAPPKPAAPPRSSFMGGRGAGWFKKR